MIKNRISIMSALFNVNIIFIAVAVVFFMAGASSVAHAKKTGADQKTFASPEEAVNALVKAIKKSDNKNLNAIFGKSSTKMISSGDKVADRLSHKRFIEAYGEKHLIQSESSDKAVLHVGKTDWPFPIPIIKKGNRWIFDTKAGKEELINRRIGQNELNAIDVLQGYADAQREYAERDRDGDGILEYAQKIVSEKGKKDGLYWDAGEGVEESPIGPFIAEAAGEGYTKKKGTAALTAYYGYYFKILKSQGPNAAGGAYGYVVKDNMLLGFAMIAWPAKYGSSGIMTFIVNQAGVVYEKDLGENTGKIAPAIETYDPDKTWIKMEAQHEKAAEADKKKIK